MSVIQAYYARVSEILAEVFDKEADNMEKAAEVLAAFEREGMCLVRRREEGEWVLLEMARAPAA